MLGGGQHRQDARLVAQEALDEIRHRGGAGLVLQRERVAEGIVRGHHRGGRHAQPQLSADRSLAKIGMSRHTPFSRALATVIQVGWYR